MEAARLLPVRLLEVEKFDINLSNEQQGEQDANKEAH
jgi:hypothetical protein